MEKATLMVLLLIFGYGFVCFALLLGCARVVDQYWPRPKEHSITTSQEKQVV